MNLKNQQTINVLSILLAISLAVVSIAGAFLQGIYDREVPSMAAQGVGQDIVDLFLVVPLLLISLYYTNRKSRTAAFLLGGTLAYTMYSFVIYSLGVHFNKLFLLYCSTLGLSLFAFIIFMRDLLNHDLNNWFENPPKKSVGIYMIFVALIFYALWLKSVMPAIIQNTVPEDVYKYNLLVNPVHVIDISFALPSLIIGGILLMKGKSTGFAIASISLVFIMILTIALAGMVIMLLIKGISEDFTTAIVFGVLTVITIFFLVALLNKLKSPENN